MTDLEINKALALAIGWTSDRIREDWNGAIAIDLGEVPWPYVQWQTFDYRDPSVIWPIAERYNAFPEHRADGWHALTVQAEPFKVRRAQADTAAKAVALVVIA